MKYRYFGETPHAVSVLVDIVKTSIDEDGNRKLPEAFWMFGLPGTGKDTLVEAFIRNIYALKYNLPEVDISGISSSARQCEALFGL